jgi:hypothetical protein
MLERRITFHEIKDVAMKAKRIEAYSDSKRALPAGTTSWRLHGSDYDGEPLTVAIDLTTDHLGSFVVVVTVF